MLGTFLIAAILGGNIWKLREAWGWAQEQLAEKAGYSRAYIAWLETGKQDPTLTTLKNLAKALKVTVGELVE